MAESDGELFEVTISSGGASTERFGGLSVATLVEPGGIDVVSAAGLAIDEQLSGRLIVLSGGIGSGIDIENGGFELVSGGMSEGDVFGGGELMVVSSGVGSNYIIHSGGVAIAETGGAFTEGPEVQSGGISIERNFGSASGSIVEAGGVDTVSSSGIAISAHLSGGLQVLSGGTTSATTVFTGGRQFISSGGIAVGTTVSSGGSEVVAFDGTVRGATISASGKIEIGAGSTIQGMVTGLGAGTLEFGGGAGSLSGMSGGNVTVAGVTTAAAAFTNFAKLQIDANASFTTAGTETLSAAHGLVVDGTLNASGTLSVAGNLTVGGTTTGARTLAGTGTLALTAGNTFVGTGAHLTIAHVTQSGGAVSINETALTYAGVWTQTAGTVNVSAAHTLTFTGAGDRFSGTLTGAGAVRFTAGSDLLSGVTLSAASSTVISGANVTLSGAIMLTKTLTVTSPNLTVAAAGATLSGGGTLALTNSATNKVVGASAAATLTNASNIQGAGNLGGGSMKLVNDGTIAGNSATIALTIDTGANAITNDGTILSEGKGGVTIKSALVNTGSLTVSLGTLSVLGAVTGSGDVEIDGGAADFASSFNGGVDFGGSTGVLELGKSQTYTGTILGFSLTGGTSLDLRDIGFTTGHTTAKFVDGGSETGGILTVTNGSQTAHIALAGNFTGSTFTTSSDGHGGTIVVDPAKHGPAAMAKPATVLPFITAMAGFDPGGGHWVPAAESGRSFTPLMALAHRLG